MSEKLTREIPQSVARIAGLLVLLTGLAAGYLAVGVSVRVLSTGSGIGAWLNVLLTLVLFGATGVVLVVAGFRLIFAKPGKPGSMLPRWLWRPLAWFLGVATVVGLLGLVLSRQLDETKLVKLLMMGTLVAACFRFGRPTAR